MATFRSIGVPGNPTICVELDWTNDPSSDTYTWEDITAYVVSYQREPVRVNEFDQPGPAGAVVLLDNSDGRFTPDNTGGPYYGGLKKYRRMRVRCQWLGVTYNRYWGFVLDWPQTWDSAGQDQMVTVQLVDALTPLLSYDLQGQSFVSDLSGAEVGYVLGAAGAWGSGESGHGLHAWSLDAGVSSIVASGTLTTNSFAAQQLKDIGASEMGLTFADGGGTICFHDRHHRLTETASTTVQATIGDTAGAIRYTDPNPMFGDAWPIVQVTPYGASSPQVSTVDAGTASFFQQTLTYPTAGQYLVSSSSEALAAAQYLSNRYSDPVTRVDYVTAIGSRDTSTWPVLLGLDTSDLVVFERRFLENGMVGGTISLSQFVEGYGDDVSVGRDWRVRLAMSPADTQSYWVAEDSRLGLAGETTRGAY